MKLNNYVLVALINLTAVSVNAAPGDFVIFLPRLGVDAKAADPYMVKFATYMKGDAKGTFVAKRRELDQYLETNQPGFAVLEPHIYAELRQVYALEPIAQLQSPGLAAQHLYLLVSASSKKSLSELKGAQLWTALAENPEYLSKVVFNGKVDASQHFALKSIGHGFRGVRAVLSGKAEATLIDDEQLKQAQKLPDWNKLRVAFTSAQLPPIVVAAFSKTISKLQRKQLTKQLRSMCTSSEGAALCKEMLIEQFLPINRKQLTKLSF